MRNACQVAGADKEAGEQKSAEDAEQKRLQSKQP
jgi:hypothetical protein